MDTLREIFHLPDEILYEVLEAADHDLEAAIVALLDAPQVQAGPADEPEQEPEPEPEPEPEQDQDQDQDQDLDLEDPRHASPADSFRGLRLGEDEDGREEHDDPEFIEIDRPVTQRAAPAAAGSQDLELAPTPPSEDEVLATVLSIFTDACPDFVKAQYQEHIARGARVVEFLANQFVEGGYEKASRGQKRKRRDSWEAGRKGSPAPVPAYAAEDRLPESADYKQTTRVLLLHEFPLIPANFVGTVLARSHGFLAVAYPQLVDADDNYTPGESPYKRLLKARRLSDEMQERMGNCWAQLTDELEYARTVSRKAKMDTQLAKDAKVAAEMNEKEAAEAGNLYECKCCFSDYEFEKITHCDELHFFCLDCAKANAEHTLGNGKFKLHCMDTSGCQAEFPRREVIRFVDEKTIRALEKIQQEDALRNADIEGLVECPFCQFAAICPPIEEDREFRCQNLECEEVSCRLCQRKSHIPRSCDEVAKDDKINVRHKVEEAMTEAMVRHCKKCSQAYVKDDGCNKIHCSKCGSLLCYICQKVIKDYKHFNDASRGGNSGNCPLFDNTEARHENEIQAAAAKASEQLKSENPDISEEDLKIKLSAEVERREQARREELERRYPAAAHNGVGNHLEEAERAFARANERIRRARADIQARAAPDMQEQIRLQRDRIALQQAALRQEHDILLARQRQAPNAPPFAPGPAPDPMFYQAAPARPGRPNPHVLPLFVPQPPAFQPYNGNPGGYDRFLAAMARGDNAVPMGFGEPGFGGPVGGNGGENLNPGAVMGLGGGENNPAGPGAARRRNRIRRAAQENAVPVPGVADVFGQGLEAWPQGFPPAPVRDRNGRVN